MMKNLREITATSLRRDLFKVLGNPSKNLPTRIRYKKGDSVILSYQQYIDLMAPSPQKSRRGKALKKLKPLLQGKILKPLNEESEKTLLHYMGIR